LGVEVHAGFSPSIYSIVYIAWRGRKPAISLTVQELVSSGRLAAWTEHHEALPLEGRSRGGRSDEAQECQSIRRACRLAFARLRCRQSYQDIFGI
jgi:hypothetical protein